MSRRPINNHKPSVKRPTFINLSLLNRCSVEQLQAYSIVYNMSYQIHDGVITHYFMK